MILEPKSNTLVLVALPQFSKSLLYSLNLSYSRARRQRSQLALIAQIFQVYMYI